MTVQVANNLHPERHTETAQKFSSLFVHSFKSESLFGYPVAGLQLGFGLSLLLELLLGETVRVSAHQPFGISQSSLSTAAACSGQRKPSRVAFDVIVCRSESAHGAIKMTRQPDGRTSSSIFVFFLQMPSHDDSSFAQHLTVSKLLIKASLLSAGIVPPSAGAPFLTTPLEIVLPRSFSFFMGFISLLGWYTPWSSDAMLISRRGTSASIARSGREDLMSLLHTRFGPAQKSAHVVLN